MKKLFLSLFLLTLPLTVLAVNPPNPDATDPASYELLAPIPLGQNGPSGGDVTEVSIETYIPAMIKLIIAIAGALAVIRIILAGIQYMSTDAFGKKGEARGTITNAIIGLLLAIGAYTILNTLNPQLVNFDFNIANQDASLIGDATLGNTVDIRCSTTNICTGLAVTCTAGQPCSNGNIKQCSNATPCITGIQMCKDCVLVLDTDTSNFNHKKSTDTPPGCSLGGPCQVTQKMYTFLSTMKTKTPATLHWKVTEMYPPTIVHKDDCHSLGNCVDMVIIPNATTTIVSTAEIKALFKTIDDAKDAGVVSGVKYTYEMCDASKTLTRVTAFLAANANDDFIKSHKDHFNCFQSTTSDNLHLEVGL